MKKKTYYCIEFRKTKGIYKFFNNLKIKKSIGVDLFFINDKLFVNQYEEYRFQDKCKTTKFNQAQIMEVFKHYHKDNKKLGYKIEIISDYFGEDAGIELKDAFGNIILYICLHNGLIEFCEEYEEIAKHLLRDYFK